jgi:hypothetical protein
LVLMLQLSAGKPFDVLLWDIIKDLPNTDSQPFYQAFGVLCCFFQHGIMVPLDILQCCLPPSNYLEQSIRSGLEGLIDTLTYNYAGYEGFTPVHELIAKTVISLGFDADGRPDSRCRPTGKQNPPYSWSNPPLLEQHLKSILSRINTNIDANQETLRRWISQNLRRLAVNGEIELVDNILRNYAPAIDTIQQQNTFTVWLCWIRIYSALGWSGDTQRCIQSILLTQPDLASESRSWLSLINKLDSREQQQTAIAQTQSWLDTHPAYWHVSTRYLALVKRLGSQDQQQKAIAQTQSWLEMNRDNEAVRTKYIAVIRKFGSQDQIRQQWEWIVKQQPIDQNLWNAFLPTMHHHILSELYPTVISLVLRKHPDNISIACQLFGCLRDHLDYETCYELATRISQFQLPIDKYQNFIYAANFFRDYNEFDIAEDIYRRTISTAKKKEQQFPVLRKAIDFANLNYAQLLLLTAPPQADQALQKLDDILARNRKHGFAHLLVAQAYQAKDPSFRIKAKHHFEKALEFDREKKGFFSYRFGCFYRYAVGDITNARKYFQQSLTQKLNLPASIELAELEDNYEWAKTLLQDGLSLIPITRSEKEEREKFHDRIATLAALLDMPEAATPYAHR